MSTEELLEQCLQALASGDDLPPELARYLARHSDQRAEVEDMLAIARQVSNLQPADLDPVARRNMQSRLATRLNLDPTVFDEAAQEEPQAVDDQLPQHRSKKRLLLPIYRLSYSNLLAATSGSHHDAQSEARIRKAFEGLTSEDIRRYIGVKGTDYLYYRQTFPGWEPIFSLIALVLKGLKRLESLGT